MGLKAEIKDPPTAPTFWGEKKNQKPEEFLEKE